MTNGPDSPPRRPWLRGAARGVVAAMAMSGIRQVAVGLGMIERTPPDAILREGVPAVLRRVPEHRRTAFVEFAHWGYGAAAGAAFGLVPGRLRSSRLAGPVYGVLSWGLFELALAPALDLAHAHRARPRERVALLVDHLVFGLILGAPPEAGMTGPGERTGPREETGCRGRKDRERADAAGSGFATARAHAGTRLHEKSCVALISGTPNQRAREVRAFHKSVVGTPLSFHDCPDRGFFSRR